MTRSNIMQQNSDNRSVTTSLTVAVMVMTLVGNIGCVHWKHCLREHCVLGEAAKQHQGDFYHCPHCGKIVPGEGFNGCPRCKETPAFHGYEPTCWRQFPTGWGCAPEHVTGSELHQEGMLESTRPQIIESYEEIPSGQPGANEETIRSSGDIDAEAARNQPLLNDASSLTVQKSNKANRSQTIKPTAKAGTTVQAASAPKQKTRTTIAPTPAQANPKNARSVSGVVNNTIKTASRAPVPSVIAPKPRPVVKASRAKQTVRSTPRQARQTVKKPATSQTDRPKTATAQPTPLQVKPASPSSRPTTRVTKAQPQRRPGSFARSTQTHRQAGVPGVVKKSPTVARTRPVVPAAPRPAFVNGPTPAPPIKPATKAVSADVKQPASMNRLLSSAPEQHQVWKPAGMQRRETTARPTIPNVKRVPLPVASQLKQVPAVAANKPIVSLTRKVIVPQKLSPAVAPRPAVSNNDQIQINRFTAASSITRIPLPLDRAKPTKSVVKESVTVNRTPKATRNVIEDTRTLANRRAAVSKVDGNQSPPAKVGKKVIPRDAQGPIPIRKVKLHIDAEPEDKVYSLSDQLPAPRREISTPVPAHSQPTVLKTAPRRADNEGGSYTFSDRYSKPIRRIQVTGTSGELEPVQLQRDGDAAPPGGFPTPVRRIQLTRFQK